MPRLQKETRCKKSSAECKYQPNCVFSHSIKEQEDALAMTRGGGGSSGGYYGAPRAEHHSAPLRGVGAPPPRAPHAAGLHPRAALPVRLAPLPAVVQPARFGARVPTGAHPGSTATALPFALWFDALRAWPDLGGEATRSQREGLFVGFGALVEGDQRRLRVRLQGLEPLRAQRSTRAGADALRLALCALEDGEAAADQDGRGGGAAGTACEDADLVDFLARSEVPKPRDLGARDEHVANEQTDLVSGGGDWHIGDLVAVLLKCKQRRPQAHGGGGSGSGGHEAADQSPSWYLERVLRLRCGSAASASAAAAAWPRTALSGSLAALGAALADAKSSSSSARAFVARLADMLALGPGGGGSSSGGGGGVRAQPQPDTLRAVLSALLALRSTWEVLHTALESGSQEALVLLTAGARAAVERVLTAAAALLAGVLQTAAAQGGSRLSSGVGEVTAALVARLPGAQLRPSRAERDRRAAALNPSSATPWLQLPLVPTVEDLQGGKAWLSPAQLSGLERTYASKAAYLERLFRLLRADALADMSLSVHKLSLGEEVPDRDLRRYTSLRVQGYRAHGGAVQVALSIRPVSVPRLGLAKEKRLMDGSLVCIAPSGRWGDLAALQWALVAPARDALDVGMVVLELLPGAGSDDTGALAALLTAPAGAAEMVENPAFFTSSRFALERLQRLGAAEAAHELDPSSEVGPQLPFVEELVQCKLQRAVGPDTPDPSGWLNSIEDALDTGRMDAVLKKLGKKLDTAQEDTVINALEYRVWVSQGPPGTGKTTASVAFFSLVRMLLTPQPGSQAPVAARPILMLAIKNHALDQFLARIGAAHPSLRLVRVGGKAASKELEESNLSHLRNEAIRACQNREAAGDLLDAWRARGAARQEVREAQEVLGDALEIMRIGVLPARSFLESLTLQQRRTLRSGTAVSREAFGDDEEAFDLAVLRRWAAEADDESAWRAFESVGGERASLRQSLLLVPRSVDSGEASAGGGGDGGGGGGGGGGGSGGGSGGDRVGSPFSALPGHHWHAAWLRQVADHLADLGGGPVLLATLGSQVPYLGPDAKPKLKALVSACADVFTLVKIGGADAVELVSAVVPSARAPAGRQASPEAIAYDISTDVDAILREARAAQLLDEEEEEEEEEEEVVEVVEEDAAPGVRRQRRGRAAPAPSAAALGGAGVSAAHSRVLTDLGMARLRSSSGGDSSHPLAALAFTRGELKTFYATLIDEQERSVRPLAEESLWGLTPLSRAVLVHRATRSYLAATSTASQRFREAAEAERLAAATFDAAAVGGAAVIGMTINGAAKYAALLEVLQPQVVIVEEAAEVLEPTLVAALPSSARLLFMAGDHEQLPPKPNYYPFERPGGGAGGEPAFNLGRSLFKRLVECKVHYGRLKTQSRMHPHLADVVRAVGAYGPGGYIDNPDPDIDLQGTLAAAAEHQARGPHYGPFWKHAAFWWSHSAPEDAAQHASGHRNSEEARRAARAAAWHMLQGVHPSRIVVLTGYAAQVALIRRELLNASNLPPETIDVACAGLAEGEVSASAGSGGGGGSGSGSLTAAAAAAAAQKHPRVCTIDEFQGDEADHVILSLVRSGERLGFLKDRERLVVALSRAKRSLLIIGNVAAMAQNPHWLKAIDHLHDKRAVCDSLPLVCPRHSSATTHQEARDASSVPVAPAHVFCKLPCGRQLPCDHECPCQTCHSDAEHAAVRCPMPLGKTLPCGHFLEAACHMFSEAALTVRKFPPCRTPCPLTMPCGHPCPLPCHKGSDAHHGEAMRKCRSKVPFTQRCGHPAMLDCRFASGLEAPLPPCPEPCPRKLPDPCGHSCAKTCGEACSASADGSECGTCSALLQERRRAAVEQAIAIANLALQKVSADDKIDLPDVGEAEFASVQELVLRSIRPGHNVTIKVLRVQRVVAYARERAYWEAVTDMVGDGDLRTAPLRLFHGTATDNVMGILREGFRIRRARASAGVQSHAENMLGAAVYLCPDSSKSARREYLGGDTGALLLCDVLKGTVKEVKSADQKLDDAQRRAAERYDSVMMRRTAPGRKTDVVYDEYAVYDPRLVLPRHVITVAVLRDAPAALPVPGSSAMQPTEMVGGVSFYDFSPADALVPGSIAGHFCLAQTVIQLMATRPGDAKRLTKVRYCHNPALEDQFEKAMDTLEMAGLPSTCEYAYHGTAAESIRLIQLQGFKLPGVSVDVRNGTAHGRGIYLGETPELSEAYAQGQKCMLLVAALPGQSGPPLTEGTISTDDTALRAGKFQSHRPNNNMLIVASPVLIVPRYVVYWD